MARFVSLIFLSPPPQQQLINGSFVERRSCLWVENKSRVAAALYRSDDNYIAEMPKVERKKLYARVAFASKMQMSFYLDSASA